jgi:hypothetical protein
MISFKPSPSLLALKRFSFGQRDGVGIRSTIQSRKEEERRVEVQNLIRQCRHSGHCDGGSKPSARVDWPLNRGGACASKRRCIIQNPRVESDGTANRMAITASRAKLSRCVSLWTCRAHRCTTGCMYSISTQIFHFLPLGNSWVEGVPRR